MSSCKDETPVTELFVIVDTDIPTIERVTIEVEGLGDTRSAEAHTDDGAFPRRLGIVHGGGALGPIDVTVRGFEASGDGPALVEPRHGLFFQKDRIVTLSVVLYAACVGACTADEACLAQGECASADGPWELGEWDGLATSIPDVEIGGDPDDPDDGAPDDGSDAAAMDAATDSATDSATDAATDTPVDAAVDGGADGGALPPAGCGSAAGKRKRLTVDGARVSGTLTDFPVQVSLTDADLMASATPSGADLCFTGADGVTALPFEVEAWNRATGRLDAWVALPSLASAQNTTFHLH